jgi:hypothetical protein
MIFSTVCSSPFGNSLPSPGQCSLAVGDSVEAWPSLNAVVSSFPKLVSDAWVLSSSDMRASFSIVGSAFSQREKGSGSRFEAVGVVVVVVLVLVVLELVVLVLELEHTKWGSPQPFSKAGLP